MFSSVQFSSNSISFIHSLTSALFYSRLGIIPGTWTSPIIAGRYTEITGLAFMSRKRGVTGELSYYLWNRTSSVPKSVPRG